MPAFNDQRTAEERKTHTWGVAARDRFLTGCGAARGGASVAVWACATHAEAEAVARRVAAQKEMRNVRIVDLRRWRVPRGAGHVSIYVVEEGQR